MKFLKKNIQNWRSWKMTFFWVGHFEFFFSNKNWFFIFFPMKNNLAVLMRYHLFLQYGWLLQNLGKDFIQSIMHTTVRAPINLFDENKTTKWVWKSLQRQKHVCLRLKVIWTWHVVKSHISNLLIYLSE